MKEMGYSTNSPVKSVSISFIIYRDKVHH